VLTPQQQITLYRETNYDVRLPGGARATLRIGRPVPESLRSWTRHDWPLFFVSACNPSSKKLTAIENRNRTRALMENLDRSRTRRLIGVGHMVHQPWREPSFLVAGLSIELADHLAVAFAQNAIVIAVSPTSTRLRIYRKDWRSRIDNDADIMWTGN
jgi:hypothetical protein